MSVLLAALIICLLCLALTRRPIRTLPSTASSTRERLEQVYAAFVQGRGAGMTVRDVLARDPASCARVSYDPTDGKWIAYLSGPGWDDGDTISRVTDGGPVVALSHLLAAPALTDEQRAALRGPR